MRRIRIVIPRLRIVIMEEDEKRWYVENELLCSLQLFKKNLLSTRSTQPAANVIKKQPTSKQFE